MNYRNYCTLSDDYSLLGSKCDNNKLSPSRENLHEFHPALLTGSNKNKDMRDIALKGIQEKSELSDLFFSVGNMKRLQKMIKKAVYEKTKGKYKLDTDQEERDLYIFMRAVYMEEGIFIEGQVVRQVKRLNKKVIEEIVPGIITNLKQYYGYLEEINKPITPIDRPMNVSNAGRKTLPSITTTFNI